MMTTSDLAQALRQALSKDDLPVPVRALVAGVLMCARGGAPSRLGMSKVGDYSYGSSQNHYSDLLDVLVDRLPKITASMSSGPVDPVEVAKLREDVQRRDRVIAELRQELRTREHRLENLRRYALALHERLRVLEEQGSQSGARVLEIHRTDDGTPLS